MFVNYNINREYNQAWSCTCQSLAGVLNTPQLHLLSSSKVWMITHQVSSAMLPVSILTESNSFTTCSNRSPLSKLISRLKDSRVLSSTLNPLANSSHLAEWHLIKWKMSEWSGDLLRMRVSSEKNYEYGKTDI